MFDSIHSSKPETMISGIWELLCQADAVVTYYGSRYDIPMLNSEFIKYSLPPPDPYREIDLYKTIKKRFKFPYYKLEYISDILGVGHKVSHQGQELWNLCMEGDDKAWKLMEKYNKRDVDLTYGVYERILPWIDNHPNYGLFLQLNTPVCPNCGSTSVKKNGKQVNKTTRSYQRYRCTSCLTPLRSNRSIKSDSPLLVNA